MLDLFLSLVLLAAIVHSQEICEVCGVGAVVTNPDAIFIFPGQPEVTCGALEGAGLAGLIPVVNCPFLPPLISVCECAVGTNAPDAYVSPSPTPSPPPSPLNTPTPTTAPLSAPTVTPVPPPTTAPIPTLPPPTISPGRIPCPNPLSGGCSICGNGMCIQNPTNRYIFSDGNDLSCRSLQTYAFQGGLSWSQCAQVYISGLPEQCGCGDTLPQPEDCDVDNDDLSDLRTTTFQIQFFGDLSEATSCEINALENAFRDVFNALNGFSNPEFCDPDESRIIRVSFEDSFGTSRHLQNILNRRRVPSRPVIIKIDWKCKNNCPKKSISGNDASILRKMKEIQPRFLDTPDPCECPTNGIELRSPTTEEITAAYGAAVRTLVSQGRLYSIDDVADVSEVRETFCNGETLVQEADVTFDFVGNRDEVIAGGNADLEEAFRIAYNGIARDSCDPLFRTVQSFKITEVGNYYDISNGERRELQTGVVRSSRFRVVGKARYQCKNCPVGTGLAGNDGGRRLDPEFAHRVMQAYVESTLSPTANPTTVNPTTFNPTTPNPTTPKPTTIKPTTSDDLCYCSVYPATFDPPTEAYLAIEFGRIITQVFQVPGVASVANVAVSSPRQETPCPGPNSGGCSICGSRSCVQNPTNRFFFKDGFEISCGTLQSIAFQGGFTINECASIYLQGVQEQCGCGDTAFIKQTPAPTTPPSTVSCPQPGPYGCSPCGNQHCVQFLNNEFAPGVSCGQLQARYFQGPFPYRDCAFIYSDVFNRCGCVG